MRYTNQQLGSHLQFIAYHGRSETPSYPMNIYTNVRSFLHDLHIEVNENASKEKYLEWVQNWKLLYSIVTDAITYMKAARNNKEFSAVVRSQKQSDYEKTREIANSLLIARRNFKIVAAHASEREFGN